MKNIINRVVFAFARVTRKSSKISSLIDQTDMVNSDVQGKVISNVN